MASVSSETIASEELFKAINKSQCFIEFDMNGIIINCNQMFLDALGYTFSEVKGKHHRIFCEESYVNSQEYNKFWEKLNRGEFDAGEYKRIGKNGKEIYIQATYNPIFDSNNNPIRVLKFATDVTARKLRDAEAGGVMAAVQKYQAIIEFNMDGTVITANKKFLDIIGYSLEEIVGKHHRIFCEKNYANSDQYKEFWEKLNRGEFDVGEYKRISKKGKEAFIQATYSPIFDLNNKPMKVIKFAADITDRKVSNAEYKGKLEAISKSLGTIEFNMDGTVITANDVFLDIIGYSLEEVVGKHHRIFCPDSYSSSDEYTDFWKKMNRGEFESGQYLRIAKNGKEAYIQATYNPILDVNNKPFKVLKIASDITSQKAQSVEFKCTLEAIDKSLGTIEFNMDGTVISANNKFLDVIGYSLDEVVGKHHRIFCEKSYTNSHTYTDFWKKMNSGKFETGEYRRIAKSGKEVYIQASYNPILDLNNRPVKVLKIATDVTDKKRREDESAKQAALIMDMSTPVMRLWDNVLLLPIIGLVDSKRVQTIMESALQNILDYQAKFLILDIQGVPAIVSAVANYLIKVTQATKLMGCRCIVTGISPQISQALVNLGIDLGNIITQSNLKDGVSMSLKELGLKLVILDENI